VREGPLARGEVNGGGVLKKKEITLKAK